MPLLPQPETRRGRIVDAALTLVASAASADVLGFLNARRIADALPDEKETNVRSALDPRSGPRRERKQMDRGYLARLMLDRALDHVRIAALARADSYLRAAEAVAGGGGRESVRPAILANLRRLAADEQAPAGRDRMYYLALALADVDGDLAEALADSYDETQDAFASVYEAFLRATGRQLATGASHASLRQTMSALFEGFGAHRRLGVRVADDDVVEAVLRVFAGFTRGDADPEREVDELLFGQPRPAGDHGRLDGAAHHTSTSLYDAAIHAIETHGGRGVTVAICSLHGHRSGGQGPPTEEADRLRDAVLEHVASGGHLRRVTSYSSSARLDHDLAELERLGAASRRAVVETKACTLDILPSLAPLVVGGHVGFLALDNHQRRGASSGVEMRGAHGVRLAKQAFEDLWGDSRTEWVWSSAGAYEEGIERLRARLGGASAPPSGTHDDKAGGASR